MGTKKQPGQLATTLDNLEQYGTPEAIEARWDKAAAKFANRGNSSLAMGGGRFQKGEDCHSFRTPWLSSLIIFIRKPRV